MTDARNDIRKPHILLSLWFGCGLMRPAPGTWGTLGGMPFALIFLALGGPLLLATMLALLLPLAWWAVGKHEKETGQHDSSIIVIDEVAGIWLALIPAGMNPLLIVAAFLLFRFFDILKPWPVSYFDRNVPGASGVMLDDIAAGLYAGLFVTGLAYAGLG